MPRALRGRAAAAAPRHDPLRRADADAQPAAAISSRASSRQASIKEEEAKPSTELEYATPAPPTRLAASRDNYLFLIRLENSENPCISRLLSVPPTLTFERFHEVL